MPRNTSRREETGKWICAESRHQICPTSCTYSPGSHADHFLILRGTASPGHSQLTAHCQALSRACGCLKHRIAAPAQNAPTPCSILGAPDSLILVALLRILIDPIAAGPRHQTHLGTQVTLQPHPLIQNESPTF